MGAEQTSMPIVTDVSGEDSPVIVGDGTRLWVATRYRDRTNSHYYSTRVYYSDGFGDAPTWTLSTTLDTADSTSYRHPVLFVFGTKIGVVYNDGSTTGTKDWRWRNISDPLGTWAAEATISNNSTTKIDHSVVADDNGGIHMITGDFSNLSSVWYHYYNGTSWQSAVQLESSGAGYYGISITTDGTDVWVVYPVDSGYQSYLAYRQIVSPFASENIGSLQPVNSTDDFFDKSYTYISSTYADVTSNMSTANATTMGDTTGDMIYFGHLSQYRSFSTKFIGSSYDGIGGVLAWEYWNGSSWATITSLSSFDTNLTSYIHPNFITFAAPGDWVTKEIDAANAPGTYYYIRARVTTGYTTAPQLWMVRTHTTMAYPKIPSKISGVLPIVWTEPRESVDQYAVMYSNSLSFNANPNVPSSLGGTSVTDGSTIADTTPELTFTLSDSDSGDTLKFQIQIDNDSDFSSPITDYTSVLAAQGATSFTVGQAAGSGSYTTGAASQTLADGNYYWRVKTIDNSSAESSYSTANSGSMAFQIDSTSPTDPGSPTTSSTASDTTPTWTWTASTDAVALASSPYQMQWSTSSAFSSNVFSDTASTNSFTHSTALADSTWYFRVKAVDSVANESNYSSAGSLTVDTTAPVSIDVSSPADNSYTNESLPTFKWKQTTDATSGMSKYQLVVDGRTIMDNISPTDPGGDHIREDDDKYVKYDGDYIEARSKNDNNKLANGTYSWEVKAIDNAGNARGSGTRTLYVDMDKPAVQLDSLANVFDLAIQTTSDDGDAYATTEQRPTFKGVGDAGTTIIVTINSDPITCETTVKDDSTWECKIDVDIPFGTHTVTITAENEAGNISTLPSFTLFVSSGSLDTTLLDTTTTSLEDEPKDDSCINYTVKSGDSLFSIAAALLGDSERYTEIIASNKEKYPSLVERPSDLERGWELSINCLEGTEENIGGPVEQTYEVKVRVVDSEDQPVQNATVTLFSTPREATTDENGIALFTNVERGDHKIIIEHEGQVGEQPVTLDGEMQEFSFTIQIEPKSPFAAKPVIAVISILLLTLTAALFRTVKFQK